MELSEEKKIIVYGTSWCGSSRRTRRWLEDKQIPFEWIDIDQDLEGRKFVEQVNNGYRSVPTIVFPDGSRLVEAPLTELSKKLGIEET